MISVLIPVHNEEETLAELSERLCAVMNKIGEPYEIVIVDDGSTDSTLGKLHDLIRTKSNMRAIELSRNFGKEQAIVAGIDHAKGATIVLMDGDLQHPPEVITSMIALRDSGYDLVQGRRTHRQGDPLLRRNLSKFFYRMFATLSDARIVDGLGDFIMMHGRAVEAFRSLRETTRFNKGLYGWVGFRRTEIDYEVDIRRAGASGWSLARLFHLGLTGILSFSNTPLRLVMLIGALVSIAAMTLGAWVVIKALIVGSSLPGYTTIVFFVLFLGGVNLFCLGLVGEYVGLIFEASKNRPLYIVRSVVDMDSLTNETKEKTRKAHHLERSSFSVSKEVP
jgi:glycosyltransferase involved in cell wall biosynthesis